MNTTLETIELTGANINDYIKGIATIHHQVFPKNHLTTNFSQAKLSLYYRKIIEASDVSIIILGHSFDKRGKKEDILGYIVAGTSVSIGISKFLKNNRLYVLFTMIKKPTLLYNKIKVVIKSQVRKPFTSSVKFRLLSIAVSKDAQSRGTGTMLLNSLEEILIKKGINQYGLSVKSTNSKAILFYKKNDFTVEHTLSDSIYYKKKI